jgi:serine/threonine-protein kinase
LLREMERGPLGTLYLARDPDVNRQLMLQVLPAALTGDDGFAERFEATFQAVMALTHPYLVPVVDYGLELGQYFVATRYLPGGRLSDRLRGQPLLLAEVMPALDRLAQALDAAHGARLLHGNVSPDQVWFDFPGRAYLANAGLAPLLGASPQAGRWELLIDAAYMSPEQAAHQPLDGRSDVYALGVLLFEMLTGRQPFTAESALGMAQAHLTAGIPQLSQAVLDHFVLPPDFNAFVARALAKRPEARYPTAGLLAEAARGLFVLIRPGPGDGRAG